MPVSKLTLGTGVLRDASHENSLPGDAGSVYGRTARAMSAICECWRCGGQLRGPPGLSVLMPLPGRVPSADREFSRALPRHKKIRALQCHRGFHGWTCQGPELNFYVTRLSPKQKCRPAIRCSSPASPPVSGPARPAARAPLPSPHGTEPAPGTAGIEPQGNEPSLEFGYRRAAATCGPALRTARSWLTFLIVSAGHMPGPVGQAGAAASFRLRNASPPGPPLPCSLEW